MDGEEPWRSTRRGRPPPAASHPGVEVADTELGGAWVVDVRREPRSPVRAGWLVEFEDDIVFLTDWSATSLGLCRATPPEARGPSQSVASARRPPPRWSATPGAAPRAHERRGQRDDHCPRPVPDRPSPTSWSTSSDAPTTSRSTLAVPRLPEPFRTTSSPTPTVRARRRTTGRRGPGLRLRLPGVRRPRRRPALVDLAERRAASPRPGAAPRLGGDLPGRRRHRARHPQDRQGGRRLPPRARRPGDPGERRRDGGQALPQPEHRSFHRAAAYTEGRSTKRSRDERALKRKSTFGRLVAAGEGRCPSGRRWAALEPRLPVPYPCRSTTPRS